MGKASSNPVGDNICSPTARSGARGGNQDLPPLHYPLSNAVISWWQG